jgi:membrane protein YqaA with SNARE-associated domain
MTNHFLRQVSRFFKPVLQHWQGIQRVLRHLGGPGLFLFGIIDSSPLPTFNGLDILLAILAARRRGPWYYYAAFATAGSVVGAVLTHRMAHKAGLEYLKRKFGNRRISRAQQYFERWGTAGLAVCTAVPLPLPTSAFFAMAGVLDYPLQTYMVVVTVCRAARYGAIAAIASHYGRHFITTLRHPERHVAALVAIAATVVAAIVVTVLLRQEPKASRGAA